jgi:hypothetical protein
MTAEESAAAETYLSSVWNQILDSVQRRRALPDQPTAAPSAPTAK